MHETWNRPTPCSVCPKPVLEEANLPAWELFQVMVSQARVGGLGGFLGLDLAAFPAVCDAQGVPVEERAFLLDKMVLLSSIAVKLWNKPDPNKTK